MKLFDVVGERRIWLKGFWGFDPHLWACIGFTKEHMRDRFLQDFVLQPGAPGLVAIYVTTTAPRKNSHMVRRVVGVMEMSPEQGDLKQYVDVAALSEISENIQRGQWAYSVRANKAWTITESAWPFVSAVAQESYWPERGRYIASQGVELNHKEASSILQLPVEPAELFSGNTG
jgi:hypothetical protein